MESDPLLSLAEDARSFGSCHNRVHSSAPLSNNEVLAKAALHFKTALEVAKKQIQFSQELSLSLADQSKTKDYLIQAEQKTTQKLIQDKQDLLLQLAESKEQILSLEAKVKSLEKTVELYRHQEDELDAVKQSDAAEKLLNQNHKPDVVEPTTDSSLETDLPSVDPPPLPPKSASIKKESTRIKPPSDQVNRAVPELPEKRKSINRN